MKTETLKFSPAQQETLVRRYLPLVHSVVRGMASQLPQHADLEELTSIGTTGLLAALERYREDQRHTFEGYAILRIRGAILDEMRRMDAMPRTARQKLRKLQAAVNELEQDLGRTPTDLEIQKFLGISQKEYLKLQRQTQSYHFFSLDAPVAEESETAGSFHELIADEAQPQGFERMEQAETVAIMVEKMKTLPERQQKILALYYHEGLRLSEIAEMFQVTEARICQLHTKALQSLRASINPEA